MYRDPRNGRFIARDGLANIMTGAGTTADKRAYGFYNLIHLDQQQAEAAYRTSWLVRKIVDLPAEDMTREWRDWQADKAQIEALEAEEDRLQLPYKVYRALVLARLHGGAALYLGTGDADTTQPLDPTQIKKGGLRYVHLFSRHELSHGEKRLDPEDPWFGHPEYFEINTRRTGMSPRIHPSRMVCFIGQPVPEGSVTQGASWFWGDPIMQSIEDAVKNADQAQNGFASLIDEAAVDIISVPDLMSSVASSEYEQRMLQRLALSKLGQSTHRAKLMDSAEKWETRQISWAGIPDIISTFLNIVAGAADIPVTRLLGQSPKGLQSTGSGEERDYIYMIMAKQKRDLAPALMGRIDALLIPSALGSRPPEVYSLFAPLMQSDPKQLAEIEKLAAETVDILVRSGLVPDLALAKAVINRMVESGQWPGLDEAVDEVRQAMEIDPSGGDPNADPSAIVPVEQPQRRAANDALPRTLYVSRKVVNVAEIAAWAKAQGLPALQDDLHVTIVYSKQPLDWMKIDGEWNQDARGEITIQPGGARLVEPLGDRTAVLLFSSSALSWRHESIVRAGASHDYPDYQPHISLTGEPVDLAGVEPYRGRIVLGPEVFEEVKERA